MTYCVGMLTQAGLVLIADTRTNAGIDNISSFKKLHILADDPGRTLYLASAGSLSVTQAMLSLLKEGIADPATGEKRFVSEAPSLFRAAEIIGDAVAMARASVEDHLKSTGINGGVSLLLGGRVGGGPLGLYLIYSEGNFIACQTDTPFLQIGEHKYGKPILDRTLAWETPLDEVVKVGLISYVSTIRSNLSVGLPLDIAIVPSEAAAPNKVVRILDDDPYFYRLAATWDQLMIEARDKVPDPPFV